MHLNTRRLRQIIREELQGEQLLREAAKGISDMQNEELRIVVEDSGNGKLIELRTSDDSTIGHVQIAEHDEDLGQCYGAWMIESTKVEDVASGFGPLLYDIAIEITGNAGLMADRWSVSADALKVWEFYLKRRGHEFEFRQLDMLQDLLAANSMDGPNPGEQITPNDPSDDCDSDAALGWAIRQGTRWDTHPLNYVARRPGGATPTLNTLKKLNLIHFEQT